MIYAAEAYSYSQMRDSCNVCNGDNSTCLGCDGSPNSGFFDDACGICLEPSNPLFNQSCVDCAGVPNGLSTTDVCGLCLEPTDPKFDVSCVGCDGEPFSGKEFDDCGICDGPGCVGVSGNVLSAETRSPCCDCKGTAHGNAIINFCCDCVDYVGGNQNPYYAPGSAPPINQTVALNLYDQAAQAYARAVEYLTDVQVLSANTLQFDADTRITEMFNAVANSLLEALEKLSHPSADDDGKCWSDWFGERNDTFFVPPRDVCGICGGDNSTCVGCDGETPVGFGGLVYDDCGICGGLNRLVDVCGVCGGDNSTCRGCDGIPNSGKVFDACYGSDDPRMLTIERVLALREAYNPNDPLLEEPPGDDWFGMVSSGCSDPAAFRAACDAGEGGCCGCDGVPNSGKQRDACDVCRDLSDIDMGLWNITCNGCDGVANSGLVYDVCCDCDGNATTADACFQDLFQGDDSPFFYYDEANNVTYKSMKDAQIRAPSVWKNMLAANRTALWNERFDACGECLGWGYENSTCAGCDGVPFSMKLDDPCGVCDGNCSSCAAGEVFENATVRYTLQTLGFGVLPSHQAHQSGGCMPVVIADAIEDATGVALEEQPWNALVCTIRECWHPAVRCSPDVYFPQNRPGADTFVGTGDTVCMGWTPPPPPPGPLDRLEWYVVKFGTEWGPYTLRDMQRGYYDALNPTQSNVVVRLPLEPETVVAHVSYEVVERGFQYGRTSRDPERAGALAELFGRIFPDLTAATFSADSDNKMKTKQSETEVLYGRYRTLADMPGLERYAYPYCTSASHRMIGDPEGVADTVLWSLLMADKLSPEMYTEYYYGNGTTDDEIVDDSDDFVSEADRLLERLNLTDDSAVAGINATTNTTNTTNATNATDADATVELSEMQRLYITNVHRRHGKVTDVNPKGLLVNYNVTNLNGTEDELWNPSKERIVDNATEWLDEDCLCSSQWYYQESISDFNGKGVFSGPVEPTCFRDWTPWRQHGVDADYLIGYARFASTATGDVIIAKDGRLSLADGTRSTRDSAALSLVNASEVSMSRGGVILGAYASIVPHPGGGTMLTITGGTQYDGSRYPAQVEDLPLSAYYVRSSSRSLDVLHSWSNAVGGHTHQDYGGDMTRRGPWQIGMHGNLALSTIRTERPDPTTDRCYASFRATIPARNSVGAVFAPELVQVVPAKDSEPGVKVSWWFNATVRVSERGVSCTETSTVRRSGTEESRGNVQQRCVPALGDGYALVLYDAGVAPELLETHIRSMYVPPPSDDDDDDDFVGPKPPPSMSAPGSSSASSPVEVELPFDAVLPPRYGDLPTLREKQRERLRSVRKFGYAGLPHSLSIELDPKPAGSEGEPGSSHVSVQTRYNKPNDPHHAYRVGSTEGTTPRVAEPPASVAGIKGVDDSGDASSNRDANIAESPALLGPDLAEPARRLPDVFDMADHTISVRYIPAPSEMAAVSATRARLAPKRYFSKEAREDSFRPSPPPPASGAAAAAGPPPFPSLPSLMSVAESRARNPSDGIDDDLEHKRAYAEHWRAEARKMRANGVNYDSLRRPTHAPEETFVAKTSFDLDGMANFADDVKKQALDDAYTTRESIGINATNATTEADQSADGAKRNPAEVKAELPSAWDVYRAGGKSVQSVDPPGRLEIYIDNPHVPTLVVPIRLADVLRADNVNGTVAVGITSSNGDRGWMMADVIEFHFENHVETSP
ncbi:lectin domain-containing protein [Pycnococcus provasolii]